MNFKVVKMRWDTFSFPVKAGTPVSEYGVLANNSNAIGIIYQNIPEKPLMENQMVLVEGMVNLNMLGYTLESSAKKAMTGIEFFDGYKNYPAPEMDNELPAYTATQGKVLTVSDSGELEWEKHPQASDQAASVAEDLAGLVTDLNALLTKLKTAGIMAADE